jgi:chromosome segregation ATPase
MADLIELDVVVRNKGLKESISTTERLERQIIKASKALDQNRISQERYNKILLSAKREYEALGLKSQKATAEVRRFAAAQRDLTGSLGTSTKALKQHTEAQMAATKASNRMGVVTQQAGYQVSDFIVQVQSGTNPFVAFSQQASQLAGVLPLVASNIGLTTTAAIALSAALGIAIPLVGAIGAAYLVSRQRAKEASEGTDTFAESLKDAQQASQDLRSELKLLASGFKDVSEAAFAEAVSQAEAAVDAAQKRLDNARGIAQKGARGNLKAAEEELRIAQEQLETYRQRRSFLEQESAFYDDIIGSAEGLAAQEEALNEIFEARLGTIDDTANNYEDILGSTEGLAAQEEALNQLYESRLGTIDDTYNNYEDILGSVDGLAAQEQALNDLYESRLGTIDDTFNNYEDILGSEEGLQKSVDVLNQMYQDRLDKLQATADAYDDILGSEAGLLAAEEARLALTSVGDSGFGGGRGSDPREIAEGYFDALKQIKDQEDERAEATKKANEEAAKSFEELNDKIRDLEDAADPFREYNRELKDLDKLLKAGKISQQAYNKAVDDLNEGLGDSIQIIGDVEQAFSDWMSRGFDDFKSFVGDILNSFKQMLVDMAAAAVRNKILIPIATGVMASAGSAAAGTAMGQYAAGGAQAGTFAATLATGAKAFGTGFGSVFGAGGIGLGGSFQALGSLGSSIGSGTFMSTLGAAAPALLAVVAVVGLLTKKTKLLDSGLRATVEGFDVAIETFKLTQSSRLFGLLKGSKKLGFEDAPAELADPLIEAIGDMQQSIVDAAGTLGIGSAAFENFSYQFKLSLKGLTEEEQLQKINEEITKMGDSFASLSGHFETMNELLAAATQRYDIETRVLQLLGNQTELLIRQRERERAATHELNRGMLDQVYALEDAYSAVNSAFATVQRSIEARKAAITSSFNDIMDAIQGRLAAAQSAVGVSGGILSSLEGASGTSGMTRGAGLAYLRSLRGASRISDQKKLDDALQAIAEPSEGLYTNFVDYQRDFADQRNLIRELEEKAGHQLSTDEQTLLEIQNEADAAQARYQGQIDKLDEQLAQAQEQLNALYGINTSVKDVSAAIADLSTAVLAAIDAQAAAKAALRGAGTGGGAGAGVQQANAAGQQILNQLGQSGIAERKSDGAKFQKVNIRGSAQLLQVASDLGVKTSGKTGAQIQQAISNAGNLGVNMDNATRALQFAMGGNFGGGLRMVGERGPELEATGPSRIFSTKQTAELFRNPELVAEVRSLREEVAGLRTESRQLQASNSKYVKRNYDINRKWDTEGLPATRT